MAKQKTFTLEEAHSLLPVLRSLIKRAMDDKGAIEAVEKELQDLKHRILLSGGLFVDVKDTLAEIDAIGVQVKDLDIGLLDFPCVVEDEIVLLCWKYGEEKIEFWHGMEEGFKGRKPIDERILRGKKREKPN